MKKLKLRLIVGIAVLALFSGQAYATIQCPRTLGGEDGLLQKVMQIGEGWMELTRLFHADERRTTNERIATREAVKMIMHWRYSSLALLKCIGKDFRDGEGVLDPLGMAESLVKKLAAEAHKCVPMTLGREESCHNLGMLNLKVTECIPRTNDPDDQQTCPEPDPAAGKSSIEVWSDEPDPEDNIHLVIVVVEPPDE